MENVAGTPLTGREKMNGNNGNDGERKCCLELRSTDFIANRLAAELRTVRFPAAGGVYDEVVYPTMPAATAIEKPSTSP